MALAPEVDSTANLPSAAKAIFIGAILHFDIVVDIFATLSSRMNPMTSRIPLLLLCASMLAPLQALASPVILPDGCGDDSVSFDAKQEKGNPGLPTLTAGKALIVFVESIPGEGKWGTTIRFGLDGKWVGATKGDSYFVVEVIPGEHNLCASAQSAQKSYKKQFSRPATFTAEAGKVYYFEAKPSMVPTPNLDFSPLSDVDGKYRLKAWKFGTSKPK